MKNMCKAISFIITGFLLLIIIQDVLTPDFVWPTFQEAPQDAIQEMYSLEQKNTVQVLFLGSSQAEFYFDPMSIYERSGIATFNIGTSAQRLDDSYYLLREALSYYQPTAVVFEVSCLYRGTYNTATRYILDNMRASSRKAEYALTYANRFSQEKRIGEYLSAWFPVYEYHDRWDKLNSADFNIVHDRNLYRKGYYSCFNVSPSSLTLGWINDVSSQNRSSEAWKHEISPDIDDFTEFSNLPWNPTISEKNRDRLLQIKELCDQKGIKLLLVKTPTMMMPHNDGLAWDMEKSNEVKGMADEIGLNYIDMLYDVDLHIDWANDTLDSGYHLNIRGASKVSDFFCDYLINELQLSPAENAEFEADLPLWQKMRKTGFLVTTLELPEYLKALSAYEGITTFISAFDDMAKNLRPEEIEALNAFGLKYDLGTLKYSDSYLAVVQNGESLYEAASNRALTYSGSLPNGSKYTITSCGFVVGSKGSIRIDNVNYSMENRGINIVVVDNESGLVIDSVAFDTWADGEHKAIRSRKTNDYARYYEQYLMQQDYARGIR